MSLARPALDSSPAYSDEVLGAAVAGDPSAMRTLYEHLAPRVAGYLRARGAAEPDDLTSAVFLAVLPRLGAVTGGADGLRSLVFSVAHARLVDTYRVQSRRAEPLPYDPEGDRRSSPSAEDEAGVRLGAQRAAALLARLPESQRDVLFLRVMGDLSIQQVAEVLGTSRGAVKQHQRRGLLALRALVTDEVAAVAG